MTGEATDGATTGDIAEDLSKRHIRSFAMRRGHVTAAQRRAYSELVPGLCVPYAKTALDTPSIFGRNAPLVLEIGFGMGETTARIAAQCPDIDFLGVEVFMAGIGALARRVHEAGLVNIRIIEHDAVEVVRDMIAPGSLQGAHIFFPDPWPKARHRKRRLVQAAFVTELARVMKPGAMMRFATDWADYADQTLCLLHRDARFNWLAMQAQDWRTPPSDHVSTRYEQKRLGDCSPIWLEFQRTTA